MTTLSRLHPRICERCENPAYPGERYCLDCLTESWLTTGGENVAGLQPCGHPVSAIFSNGTTCYCAACAEKARVKE